MLPRFRVSLSIITYQIYFRNLDLNNYDWFTVGLKGVLEWFESELLYWAEPRYFCLYDFPRFLEWSVFSVNKLFFWSCFDLSLFFLFFIWVTVPLLFMYFDKTQCLEFFFTRILIFQWLNDINLYWSHCRQNW